MSKINAIQKIVFISLFITYLIFSHHFVNAKPAGSDEWRVSPRKAKIKNSIPSDELSIQQGKKVYQRECEECHGVSGKGDGPEAKKLDKTVPDFSNSKMWEQADGAIYWKIRTGRRPMPSFKKLLSKDEMWQVINYLRDDFNAD